VINSVHGCDVIAVPVNTNPNDPPPPLTLLSKVDFKFLGCLRCSQPVCCTLFFCKVCTAFHLIIRRSIWSFSWVADGYSSGQENSLLWKPMMHYRIYRGRSLSHASPVRSLSTYILRAVLILSCSSRLGLLCSPDHSGRNFICISHFCDVRYVFATCPCFGIITR
jgi:hypothetical protein